MLRHRGRETQGAAKRGGLAGRAPGVESSQCQVEGSDLL